MFSQRGGGGSGGGGGVGGGVRGGCEIYIPVFSAARLCLG